MSTPGERLAAERNMAPFDRVLAEIHELHKRKGADYGTDEDQFANIRQSERFGIPPWLGAVIRGNDKMVRIQSFAKKGRLANEPLRDSLIDWAVYAVIAVMMYDEENDDKAQASEEEGGPAGAGRATMQPRFVRYPSGDPLANQPGLSEARVWAVGLEKLSQGSQV